MEPAVQLDDIRFSYRSTPVLEGASLSLAPGELCALVGPNGAGKSTIIRLILGEIAADQGTVEVLVRAPSAAAIDGAVGYVPQRAPDDYRHFPASVEEVVGAMLPKAPALGGRWSSRSDRSSRREAVLQALRSAGIEDLARRPIGELSGGQFQRALLARALVSAPKLLLLDEPTSNLDAESADSLVRLVSSISKESGASALLVTHDLARMPDLFDRVACLHDGIVEERVPVRVGE